MKKFLLPLLAAVFFILCFTGCNNSAKNSDNDGWIEVQSISYSTQDGGDTLTSNYVWDYTEEEITQEEFCNALNISPENILEIEPGFRFPDINGTIPIDQSARKNLLNSLKNLKGTVAYSYIYSVNSQGTIFAFYKRLYSNYTLSYVKIRLFDDNSIEIKYQDNTIKVLPTSYKITYFND